MVVKFLHPGELGGLPVVKADLIVYAVDHIQHHARKEVYGKLRGDLETVIPYYTYGQPAQPGTWGHYLVSIHLCFQSNMKRLRHAYETVNQCPMGSAAGIGSAFPLNKYRMAELLGFDGVIENTMMANTAVDYYLALERSVIRKETALRRARDGFTAATHMAEQLTMEVGEPFVKTHHIVGHMVHALMDEDRLAPENMTSELMKEASVKALGFEVERTDAQIAQMLDPISSLNAKVTGGTPKPADTEKLLADARSARKEMER